MPTPYIPPQPSEAPRNDDLARLHFFLDCPNATLFYATFRSTVQATEQSVAAANAVLRQHKAVTLTMPRFKMDSELEYQVWSLNDSVNTAAATLRKAKTAVPPSLGDVSKAMDGLMAVHYLTSCTPVHVCYLSTRNLMCDGTMWTAIILCVTAMLAMVALLPCITRHGFAGHKRFAPLEGFQTVPTHSEHDVDLFGSNAMIVRELPWAVGRQFEDRPLRVRRWQADDGL